MSSCLERQGWTSGGGTRCRGATARRRLAIVAVVGVELAGLAVALGASAAGDVGAAFGFGVSARSLGVGGAHTAFLDEPAAATLNPASVGWVERVGCGSLYVQQFGGVSYGAVAFSAPYVGMSVALLDSGWITSGDDGFRYAAQALSCSVGAPIGPIAVGIRWRFLHVGAPFIGHGWAADVGTLAELGFLRVGAVFHAALASPVHYERGRDQAWDRSLSLGMAATADVAPDVLIIATIDAKGAFSRSLRLVGGVEAWIGSLAGRLGWDGAGPTLGISVRVGGAEVDWSCAARSDLGTSHRVSLEMLF